ncbi:MAG: hypothetical protein WB795_22825 [Candidatus Acidiferrales bacterium]
MAPFVVSKPVPEIVNGVSGLTEVPLSELICGGAVSALTVKLTAVEVPPPGDGLVTATGKFPACAWSVALKGMVNWLAFTKVVAWAEPLYVTVELETKLVPLMVKVCAAEPAVAADGDKPVTAGTGLFDAELPPAEELPPPQELNPAARIPITTEQAILILKRLTLSNGFFTVRSLQFQKEVKHPFMRAVRQWYFEEFVLSLWTQWVALQV